MKKSSLPLIEWIIIAYTAVQSRAILTAWFSGSLTRHAWLPFIIWLVPVVLTLYRKLSSTSNTPLLVAALALSLLGTIGSLNSLQYAALACACASLLPTTWKSLPYLAAFISWTPAFGWAIAHVVNFPILLLRIALAIAASVYMSFILLNEETECESE